MARPMYLASAVALGMWASGLASAQTAPGAVASGNLRIMQPATISSSQDLMFAVATPTAASLTTVSTPRVAASGARASAGSTGNGTPLRQSAASLGTRIPAPAQATFVVTGEAGQSISVTVPTAIDLTREGGVETALLTTNDSLADGPQFLGGEFASVGTLSFNVGGQVTLANNDVTTGTYNGVLAVVAQYN